MEEHMYQKEGQELFKGKIPVRVFGDSDEVFKTMASIMIETIKENNKLGKTTTMILPVGPIGQYPFFVEEVNRQQVPLKDCWFINMDEYLTEEQQWVPVGHRLSFRGFMDRNVYGMIDQVLANAPEQRIFPDPRDLCGVQRVIERLGGVDIAFGGIGINGHLAFNEAEDTTSVQAFAKRETRIITMSNETRCANAIGDLGGAIDAMPRYAVSIGMRQILGAKRIRLGVFRDWHRAVLRQAIFGEVSAHFPVTLLQNHPDAMILSNANAAKRPF